MLEKNTTEAHYKKYEELCQKLDAYDIEKFLFDLLKFTQGRSNLLELYNKDNMLNNIPLLFWDKSAGARTDYHTGNIVWYETDLKFPLGLSLAERVCLLKHIAVYRGLGIKPVYEQPI